MKHTVRTRTLLTTAVLMAGGLLWPVAPADSEPLEEKTKAEGKANAKKGFSERKEAQKALVESKAQEARLRAADLEPKCTDRTDTACWLEIQNKPGCYIWNHSPEPNQTVTWDGPCSDGLANGLGSGKWTHDNDRQEGSGILVDGKREGCWERRYANGQVQEGPFVDDKREGLWRRWDDKAVNHIQYANGQVQQAPVVAVSGFRSVSRTKETEDATMQRDGYHVDGKREGCWTFSRDFLNKGDQVSTMMYGPFVNNKKEGLWQFVELVKIDEGEVVEMIKYGPYADGKKHGHWVERDADGWVSEGPYADGKEHGHWVLRHADGKMMEGPYADGKEHGHWVLRRADGKMMEGPYADGKKHGHWVIRFEDGSMEEGPFVSGKKHGRWTKRYPDGGCKTFEVYFGVYSGEIDQASGERCK